MGGLPIVMEVVGHRDPAMTKRHYCELRVGATRSALDAIPAISSEKDQEGTTGGRRRKESASGVPGCVRLRPAAVGYPHEARPEMDSHAGRKHDRSMNPASDDQRQPYRGVAYHVGVASGCLVGMALFLLGCAFWPSRQDETRPDELFIDLSSACAVFIGVVIAGVAGGVLGGSVAKRCDSAIDKGTNDERPRRW
jgi:hypothetical protein